MKNHRNLSEFNKITVGAALVISLCTSVYAADKTTVYDIDIKTQTTASALMQLARKTGFQIVFPNTLGRETESPSVVGQYTLDQALGKILADTSLQYEFTDEQTLVIRAQEKDGQNKLPVEDSDLEKVEEIVVTGTHIRGVDNVGAATISFTREELDATGFSTVEQFFESLPQNLNEISVDGRTADGTSRTASANSQGATSISLRGLGPGSTLVLLNGKRRPGNINGRVFDVSAIPFSMIERVEVVTGGRSATYGSDAVAGVVNLVMRTEFDGAETQANYGEASAGAERFNFSQTFGRNFEKGGFVVGYDYRKDQPLDATDTGLVGARSRIGILPAPGLFNLVIPSEQHIGLFAGRYQLSDKAELYADAHFSSDKNEGGTLLDFLGLFDLGV